MRPTRHLVLAGWCWLVCSVPGQAGDVPDSLRPVTFRGHDFLVYVVDPRKDDLQLFWQDDQHQGLRDFDGLEKYVASKGGRLAFAANAGMFGPDSRPVGLLVVNGVEQSPLNLRDGTGNFYMKPNGVFLVNAKHEALVVESSTYPALLSTAIYATQSGPLLVYGGDIDPDFDADSKSLKIRSGVGIEPNGDAVFILARHPVNFYDFASVFVEKYKCRDALYLDGDISAFHLPGIKDPIAHSFGPMFGLVQKAP